MTSKDLMAEIRKLGGEVKNHMSLIDEKMLGQLTKKDKKESAPLATATAQAPKEAKVPKVSEKVPKIAEKVSKVSEKQTVEKKEKEKPAAAPSHPVPAAAEAGGKKTPSEKPAAVVSEPIAAGPSVAVAVQDANVLGVRFPIPVGVFASQLNLKVSEAIKTLMGMGIFANVNQLLNEAIGMKVAEKLGLKIKILSEEIEEAVEQEVEDPKRLKPRPPVVTMMGHVDHGKTSLLDAIRKTNVAAKEKGFITQHIGAYGVDIPGKGHVTFLDTPGHEAFTAMRARGANVTDVVVLVVAADDGVMPQTVEALDHAREAGCPIVVAINKIDLPNANPQRVMTGLQKIELMPEEWGGKTICVKVSAKTGEGIEQLLEMLLLEAEVLELKADPDCPAAGTVIEGHLSKGSGPVATVIVQKGTVRMGDIVVSGSYMGRVKSLKNDRGKNVKEAGPSYAAEASGLNGVPEAGETFVVVGDEKTARKITDKRILIERERSMSGAPKHLSLEDLYHRISEGNFKELKLILKADVQGSVEALTQSLEKLSNDQCRVRVIHGAAGGINESDIMLAAASDAIIIGFHVKADPKAQELSEKEGVDLRYYNIIYEAVEDVRKAMEGLLEPTYQEVVEGKVQIQKIFKSSKAGTIGGGVVNKGKVSRSNRVRLIRNQVVVFDGKLASLRRFKDDVREVAQGYECGLALEGFGDLHEGDVLEAYRVEKIATKLS